MDSNSSYIIFIHDEIIRHILSEIDASRICKRYKSFMNNELNYQHLSSQSRTDPWQYLLNVSFKDQFIRRSMYEHHRAYYLLQFWSL